MQRFVNLITENGGLVRRVNNSGIRPLPTEMRGKGVGENHKFASIASIEFIANPVTATNALKTVKGLDDVIRVSLLRADEILTKRPIRPSDAKPTFPNRGERERISPTRSYKEKIQPRASSSKAEQTQAAGKEGEKESGEHEVSTTPVAQQNEATRNTAEQKPKEDQM